MTVVNDVHPVNAAYSIEVTLDGIVILLNDVLDKNEEPPIVITLDGIVNDVISFPTGYCINSVFPLSYNTPYSSLEYSVLSSSTLILVNDVHKRNAESPIDVTLDGIAIFVNDVQE